MSSTGVIATAAALVACLVQAASLEKERLEMRERLEEERAALDSLEMQKTDVLTLLDSMERLARHSAERLFTLKAELDALAEQTALVEAMHASAQAELESQEGRLAPRLVGLYRLTRQGQAGVLFTAEDFAGLVRRARAVRAIVEKDMGLLAQAQAAAEHQRSTARLLARVRSATKLRLSILEREELLANERRERFHKVLAAVQAESLHSGRIVQQLEQADKQLALKLAQLKGAAGSGFATLKGRLPYPARGIVEVGFGKVLNPKFNTVTVQKGLDIRAAAATPAVSVAAGTVAYAGWLKGYGNLIIIDHGGGYHSLLAHLARVNVEVEKEVEQGQKVGEVGDTGSLKGAYLYFEIRFRGQAIDPAPWLSALD
jgi:murein hydrolase activator